MLIAARIIKTLVVFVFFFCGGLLILSGSGVNLDVMMQGRLGANAVVAVGASLEMLLHYLRLASFELATGILMIAVGLLIALYRT